MPAQTCSYTILFTPAISKLYNTTLSISFNDGLSVKNISANLFARDLVVPANLTFSTSALNFSNVEIGVSRAVRIAISNSSATAATSVVGSFSDAGAHFSVSSETCGNTIEASESCYLDITFTPTEEKSYYPIDFNFSYHDGNYTQNSTFSITANGVGDPFTEVTTAHTGHNKFSSVAISPRNSNLMMAEELFGMMFKSTDGGQTWVKQCKKPGAAYYNNHSNGDLSGRIVFSKASDNSAYIVCWLGSPVRIDSLSGADCPTLDGAGYSLGTAIYRNLDSDSSGNIYVTDWGSNLYKSTDYGVTFSPIATGTGLYSPVVHIDTFNETNIILASGPNGDDLYKNSLANFSIFNVVQNSVVNGQGQYIVFDPINSGYVFSNAGIFSSNSGATWNVNANYNLSNMESFHINSSGAGFRVRDNAGVIVIERTHNLITPVWSQLAASGFAVSSTGVTLNKTQLTSEGSNIALIVNMELWLSSDSGASFSKLNLPETGPASLPMVASSDGVTLYGANFYGEIYKSINLGTSWTQVATAPAAFYGSGGLTAFPHPDMPEAIIFRTPVVMKLPLLPRPMVLPQLYSGIQTGAIMIFGIIQPVLPKIPISQIHFTFMEVLTRVEYLMITVQRLLI
jgi:hypothetical protein